jgi:hypothetical protein
VVRPPTLPCRRPILHAGVSNALHSFHLTPPRLSAHVAATPSGFSTFPEAKIDTQRRCPAHAD